MIIYIYIYCYKSIPAYGLRLWGLPSVMEKYGGCWLVQCGLVAQSSASKQSEGAIRALCETLRALGVTLELKIHFGA